MDNHNKIEEFTTSDGKKIKTEEELTNKLIENTKETLNQKQQYQNKEEQDNIQKTISIAPHYTVDTKEEEIYAKDPNYNRIDNLPSKFLPYSFSHIFIRKMKVGDWISLTNAVKHKNITLFLDALDPTLSIPIRDLTYPDFVWFAYWQRLNSFPKKPLNITWISKYGNENTLEVTNSLIKTNELNITLEDYEEKIIKVGYKIPTVRDYEVSMSNMLSEEDLNLFNYSQYLQMDQYKSLKDYIENSVKHSIDKLKEGDISITDNIENIKKLINFGVIESVEVTDPQYSVDKFIERVGTSIEVLKKEKDQDEAAISYMSQMKADFLRRKEAGEDLSKPIPDTVQLGFSPWGFFPGIQK